MKQDIQDSIKKTNCYSISSYVTAVIHASRLHCVAKLRKRIGKKHPHTKPHNMNRLQFSGHLSINEVSGALTILEAGGE